MTSFVKAETPNQFAQLENENGEKSSNQAWRPKAQLEQRRSAIITTVNVFARESDFLAMLELLIEIHPDKWPRVRRFLLAMAVPASETNPDNDIA